MGLRVCSTNGAVCFATLGCNVCLLEAIDSEVLCSDETFK